MIANNLRRALYVLLVLPVGLTSQVMREHDPAPLKHWAAPLYWHPSQPEANALAARPEAAGTTPEVNTQVLTSPLIFVGMTPCRVVDTRTGSGFAGSFGAPMLVGGGTRTFPMQSNVTCTIPAAAQGYSLNITVVPPGPLGYITIYPTGQTRPTVSTLNSVQGYVVGNGAIVPAGTSGSIDVFASNASDIIIDINGYYVSLGSFTLGSLAGTGNTGLGLNALQSNTTGTGNTGSGAGALSNNTTGINNTATGFGALQVNTIGVDNTATGAGALASNTVGIQNTALGALTLQSNTLGNDNTASGTGALVNNTTGVNNTATGVSALLNNTTGSNNIAVGVVAGSLVTGSNGFNIHIGSQGAASDTGVIRIGTPANQTSFFAAGVRGVTTALNDAVPVVISSTGQLGTVLGGTAVLTVRNSAGTGTCTITFSGGLFISSTC